MENHHYLERRETKKLSSMKVFVLRADYGKYTDVFKNKNYIGIGWFEGIIPSEGDWDIYQKNQSFKN